MRLQKFLAEAGLGSRRKCELLIKGGKVRVNGKPASLGQTIDPQHDVITFKGQAIRIQAGLYLALYKPKGYLSTVSDPFRRRTILDLVKTKTRVYPVGRLDKNSEGLMLLTNDGALAYALTHPGFQVEKIYEVWVEGLPAPRDLERIRRGVMLEDSMTAPCFARVLRAEGNRKSLLEMKLHEGKKREIRRMMEQIGHPVISLRRVAIGPLRLSGLSPGEWRPLTEDEVKKLKRCAARGGESNV